MKTIGVLSLQGDFELHLKSLDELDCPNREVRNPQHLEGVSGLIIPGGESTTVGKLLISSGLDVEIKRRYEEGSLAIFGTCMGMIVIARRIENRTKDQYSLELLDATVARNAYGRQVDSFEVDIPINNAGTNGGPFHAVFIRAPRIIDTGPGIETLASYGGQPVLIRQGRILAASFHPEITSDTRIHGLFAAMCEQ
jgi:pyridoxal 5'-phosphate synthase pdxT subunit